MKSVTGAYLASLINYPHSYTFSHIGINHITIDSRLVGSSSLFVALKGVRADGHDFIQDAVRKGSPLILASIYQKKRVLQVLQHSQTRVLFVDSPLRALQSMAKGHIEKNSQLKKVGITGSVGKTTTKEILSSILQVEGNTASTIGNFNSEIGLAISAFEVENNSEFAVFEMGVDKVGEMDTMVDIFSPHIAMITNIGLSHIGKMGSIKHIAIEKGKIFHPSLTTAFIDEKNKYKHLIAKDKDFALHTFGLTSNPYITNITSLHLDGWSFLYKGMSVHLRGIGMHSLLDALGAIHIAQELGVSPFAIREGLYQFKGINGRSKVTHGNVTIIEDWYNSSVDSTHQILQCMKSSPWNGNKRVVLGSMKEMGSYTEKAHKIVAHDIRKSRIEHVYLYGKEMYTTFNSLKSERSEKSLFYTDEYEELEHIMLNETKSGDLVLLKGSRAMEMERLVPFISTMR